MHQLLNCVPVSRKRSSVAERRKDETENPKPVFREEEGYFQEQKLLFLDFCMFLT